MFTFLPKTDINSCKERYYKGCCSVYSMFTFLPKKTDINSCKQRYHEGCCSVYLMFKTESFHYEKNHKKNKTFYQRN